MQKNIKFLLIIAPILFLIISCDQKIPPNIIKKTDTLSCHIDSQFAFFKDSLFTLSTAFGLNGSNACWPDSAGNPTYKWDTTIYIKAGRNRPFDTVFWFPTDQAQNLKYFDLDIKQNPQKPGYLSVKLTPKPNYKDSTEVRVTIVGVVTTK